MLLGLGKAFSGPIHVGLENFDFDFQCYFQLDDKGYIDPILTKTELDWGDTYVTFDNWLVEALLF